ncbi:hypothetical protein BX666DRAFT_1145677 [Dichotomocladium elegans]|nr:hypothetical protein BX666DRAFT_1145677 [Dichotomocladium elegans]
MTIIVDSILIFTLDQFSAVHVILLEGTTPSPLFSSSFLFIYLFFLPFFTVAYYVLPLPPSILFSSSQAIRKESYCYDRVQRSPDFHLLLLLFFFFTFKAMSFSVLGLLFAYIVGGLTFIPLLLCIAFISNKVHAFLKADRSMLLPQKPQPLTGANKNQSPNTHTSSTSYKVGWLRVSRDEQRLPPPDASIGDMVKSYIIAGSNTSNGNSTNQQKTSNSHSSSNSSSNSSSSKINSNNSSDTHNKNRSNTKGSSRTYFGVLKHQTLYFYDSEKQLDCQGVVQVNQHTVAMHPPGLKDPELFTRPNLIKLTHVKDANAHYYINCSRCIDKEDWYHALLRASSNSSQYRESDMDQQTAIHQLITTIHSNEHHFQTQWFNAMLGRIFCAVYKTEDIKTFLYNKLISKLDKINARRPAFLDEITVRSVDPGHAQPYVTQPRLLGLSPSGVLTAEAYMQYEGAIRFEIETVLQWKYSDHLKPLRIDLVLAITLRSLEGKFLLKIKEPPTNRFWYGFYELPKMEWGVEPLVWDRRMGYSVVVRAIQSKIDELVMENIVMPNMDDITFFPTSDGAGGIFFSEGTTNNPTSPTTKPTLRRTHSSKAESTSPAPRTETPTMSSSLSEGTRDLLRTGSLIETILKTKDSAPSTSAAIAAVLSTSPGSIISTSSSSTSITTSSSSSASSSSPPGDSSLLHIPPETFHRESAMNEGTRLRKSASIARLKSKSVASTAVSQINVSPTMHRVDLADYSRKDTTSSQQQQQQPQQPQPIVSIAT